MPIYANVDMHTYSSIIIVAGDSDGIEAKGILP